MVLVLASGRPGQFNEVHDLAVYPRRQQFTQPRMTGSAGYRIDGDRVQICVGSVENPRVAENQSGTLSLELWALSEPFNGGPFEGHHLAGVEIGSVSGQYELALQPVDLAFNAPPVGTWHIVLMLREWTAAGFATRDYTSFTAPYVVAPVPVVATSTAVEAVKPVAPSAARAASPAAAKAVMPVVAKPAARASKAKASAASSARQVSVNHSRAEELAAVTGLSAKLAESIVKNRPFASLDDLRRVKGLGASGLAKV
ncbi:MAG: ComEA family DNA-binding protein, partial [Bryobacteraceae bacterium]